MLLLIITAKGYSYGKQSTRFDDDDGDEASGYGGYASYWGQGATGVSYYDDGDADDGSSEDEDEEDNDSSDCNSQDGGGSDLDVNLQAASIEETEK